MYLHQNFFPPGAMFYLSYKPLMSPIIRAQINELLSE
ncbi:hypothetical protein SAMN05216501_4277 [Pseudomonas putida]|nr:hypothetical protein SAMN05216501_4277 [Pseudomonas putida]